MNNKKIKKSHLSLLTIFIFTLLLCGCSENNTSSDALNTEFIGSWIGNMEYSMNNFRDNFSMVNDNITNGRNFSSANITKLELTKDTIYMTITSEDGTQVISNLYKIEGDQLVLSFQFGDRQRPDGMQPPDGWEPPTFDENNRSFNNSQPFNFTRPFNNGQPPQSSRGYTYSFNEDNTILYLDGSEFIKID